MRVQENVSLKSYNTFGIDVRASRFVVLDQSTDLEKLPDLPGFQDQKLILGGGSNLLFRHDFEGLVIQVGLKGIELVREEQEDVWVAVSAGENWHQLVLTCVEKGWGGIENLSLIPGAVGAAPIQNIGAYGVELKDVFDSLEALNLETGAVERFDHAACQFGYRDSVFKREMKGRYLISKVILKLSKQHRLNTSYGAIMKELEATGPGPYTIQAVSQAVIRIRQSKLPDPAVLGNAGSFFKNPEVDNSVFERIRESYPNMPFYPVREGITKIPAGWLIQEAGWKGKRFENYGVYERQALVLVNFGGAKGEDIYQLSGDIKASVAEQFGIELEREVNIV